MAVDAYLAFKSYTSGFLASESPIEAKGVGGQALVDTFGFASSEAPADDQLYRVEDYAFDVEQTLNLGSQSTGAGAGKITFNPLTITRRLDGFSPALFETACSGTPFKTVLLFLVGAGGSKTTPFVAYNFKLVAVKTITTAYDDEAPREVVTFEYGGLQVVYAKAAKAGRPTVTIGGWNRVRNVRDVNLSTVIK